MKKTVRNALAVLLALTLLLAGIPTVAFAADEEPAATAAAADLSATGELKELQPIDMLTGTTLESGPAHPHTAPRNVTLDANVDNYPLPQHRLANYLQSRGILFPGDTVTFIPRPGPTLENNGKYQYGGYSFYSNGSPKRFQPGDTWGPFEIVETYERGSAPRLSYIQKLKVIGNNPVMLKDGWAGGSGEAADVDENDFAYHVYSDASLDYIILPRYHRVIYEYPEGFDPSVLVYPDNMPALPEVIWAEDLSFSWPEMTGTLFTLPRPVNEGYVFEDYGIKWGSEDNYQASQVVSDGQECEQWRFFFHGAEDYSWRFENRKEGDEEGQPITVSVNVHKGNTVTIDANGGKINGFSRMIYNANSAYYRSLDFQEDQPVREGWVFDGYYEDAACTKLVAPNNSWDLYYIKNRYSNLGVDHLTLYARWADPDTKDIAGLKFNVPSAVYSGEPLTPEPEIKDGDYTLVKDKDYRILSYTDNVDVGSGYVVMQGIGSYRGAKEKAFSISKMPVTLHVKLDQDTYTYDGTEKKPGVTVTCDELKNLVAGTDYTISYGRNKNASTETYPAYVRVDIKSSNYSGSAVAYFTILPQKVTPTVTLARTAYTADGLAKTPAVTVTAGEQSFTSSDYNVKYENNIEPGTATATVTMKGNYEGSAAATFTLAKATKKFTASLPNGYDATFTDQYQYPEVTVKYNKKVLTKDTDYELIYKDNYSAGTATVIVSGIGSYVGTASTLSFEITPADLVEKGAAVREIDDQEYTGYPVEASVYIPNPFGWGSLTRDYHYTVSYENNVEIGVATATITGIGNYKGTLTATFNIVEPECPVEKDEATGIIINYNTIADQHLRVATLSLDDPAVSGAVVDGWEPVAAYNVSVVTGDGESRALYGRATLAFPCDDPSLRIYLVGENGYMTSFYGSHPAGYTVISTYSLGNFVIMQEKPKTLIGDVDLSGAVTNRDAVLLDRYVAGWAGYGAMIKSMDAADLDRKSGVTNRDATILDRYIAGWSGYDVFIIFV